jgi:hypothetical protein
MQRQMQNPGIQPPEASPIPDGPSASGSPGYLLGGNTRRQAARFTTVRTRKFADAALHRPG